MSRITICGFRCLVSAVLFTSAASAQRQPGATDRAPVPQQLLRARTAFIGNGGGESYGADSYFHLTKYDGGPNRAYDSFYGAVRDWGHYELVGSAADADVLLVVRFANPVVDRDNSGNTGDLPHEWIYDPQLGLSINDPKTGLPLWTITEHIEPGDDRAGNNRHFDEAVTRLVDDLERLILNPTATLEESPVLPPGAVRSALRRRRSQHAFIGMLLGGIAGGFVGSRTANYACSNDVTPIGPTITPIWPLPGTPQQLTAPKDFFCESRRGKAKMLNEFIGSIGGAIVGGVIGWILPVSS
jgi:hypothetical protein